MDIIQEHFKNDNYWLNIMTRTLYPLPSYKFVILFSELERMKLTQLPPIFLLNVTHFT